MEVRNMDKKFPLVQEFQEFPMTEEEINTILFTMVSVHMFVFDCKRYERAQTRYEERMGR